MLEEANFHHLCYLLARRLQLLTGVPAKSDDVFRVTLMSNMFVRFISHCKLGGYLDLFFLVSLVYLVISPSQQQFCGHQNVRHKRGASRLERHTNRKYNDFRPQGQQEEQVVIDGSLVREISGGGVTIRPSRRGRPGGEGRTGCCQNSSSSTSSSSTALLSANAIKTIETAVFLDQALDNRFSGQSNGLVELNKLVQTIMNQVQHLFRYSSMKIPIKIRLVLIEHIKDNEKLTGLAAPNSERGDIDAYLSNFCNWQQSRLDQDKRLWWDHAILLSGLVELSMRRARNIACEGEFTSALVFTIDNIFANNITTHCSLM